MIQIVDGLVIKLSNILMIEFFLSNNRIVVFLEQKKNSNHRKDVKGFSSTRCSIIFSIRSCSYILSGNILSTPTRKLWKQPPGGACNFIKKETLALVFSCEFCEISENTFFTEHLRTTASGCRVFFLYCT